MNETEMVAAADFDAYPVAAEAMTEAGEGWFGPVAVGAATRQAVAAWAMAVNGDDSALAAIADLEADAPGYFLLNPVFKKWVIAPGPVVTQIRVYGVKPAAEPPQLGVTWRFTGRQALPQPEPTAGPGAALEPGAVPGAVGASEPGGAAEPAPRPWDWTDGEQVFEGNLTLVLTGAAAGPSPWRLSHGGVSTLDAALGYTFKRRFETAEEYRRRTGSSAGDGVLVPTDTYLLDAGFAEHDEKFGSSAQLEVSSDPAPTREEAERLIWPAIWEETRRALGEGDWRPSLGWLDMIRLLGPAPAGSD
jgi:hypothetical protein